MAECGIVKAAFLNCLMSSEYCNKQMKFERLLFLGFFASMLAMSCKKDESTVSTMSPQLLGKWSLVNEQWNWIPFTNNDSTYVGQPGDYYEFTANGNVFARWGGYLDTATYSYVSFAPDQIRILYLKWYGSSYSSSEGPKYTISGLTLNSVSLVDSPISPIGIYSDIINLKR